MSRRAGLALGGLALAVLVFLEYAAFAGSPVSTTAFDSGIFLRCAERSPFAAKFWNAVRPPVVPLVYRLAGGDGESIRLVQSAVSLAAWVGLGLAFARLAPAGWARRVALVLPPLLSLSIPVNQWDGIVMSESLFLSLMAAATAMTVVLLRAPSFPVLIAWCVAALAFALVRDSAAYLLLVGVAAIALRLFIGLARRIDGRGTSLVFAAAVAVGLIALVSARASMHGGERWRTPLVNVILRRVLPDPELAEIWRDRYGLPRNEVFEAQAGKLAWNRIPGGRQLRHELESDARLAPVDRWLAETGVDAYQRYLLFDEPVRAWRDALEGFRIGVNPEPPVAATAEEPGGYAQGASVRQWSLLLSALTYAHVPRPELVCLAAAFVALVLARSTRATRARPLALFAVALFAGAVTQAFVTWHGDAAEVDRHVVVAGVLFRIGIGALVLGSLVSVRGFREPAETATHGAA